MARLVACVIVLALCAPARGFVLNTQKSSVIAVAPASRTFRAVLNAEVQPYERPGNYVQPYGSALGVSSAALLCGELIRIPGTSDAAVSILGRVAGLSQLPLVAASLYMLRAASFSGPALLATPTYERLNLGVAFASIAACIVSPRPVVSVVVARVGTALLCLEVWSKFSGAKAGDPISEVTTALKSTARAVRRSIDLVCAGLSGNSDGTDPAVTPAVVPASYAALALVQLVIALAACGMPSAVSALFPVVSPGMGAARTATSSAILSAVCATTLADAAATRPASSSGQLLRPFRWLNRAMIASAATSLVVQAGATCLVGASAVRNLGGGALAAAAAAQLVQLATVALCVQQDSLWSN